MTAEQETRTQIAQLLTGRCNNCYSTLPGPVGCSVHSAGWNWVTPNFGPFCDDCFKEVGVRTCCICSTVGPWTDINTDVSRDCPTGKKPCCPTCFANMACP